VTGHLGLEMGRPPLFVNGPVANPPHATLRRTAWPLTIVVAASVAGYLAVRQPLLVGLAVAILAVAPITLRRPDLLILSAVPLSVVHMLFAYGDNPRLAMVVSVAVGLSLVPAVRSQTVQVRARMGWPLLCAAALAVLLVASTSVPGDYGAPELPGRFGGLSHLIVLIAGLTLLAAATVMPPNPLVVARLVVVAGAVIATYALLDGSYSMGRLDGLGLNCNYLAAVLAPSVGAGIAVARQARRLSWLVPTAVCLAAVQQTQSRGGMLAAVAGVVVALIADRPARQRMAALGLIAATGALVFVFRGPLWGVVFGARPTSQLTDDSGRTNVVRAALDAVAEHPINGIGYRMFPYYAMNDPHVGRYLYTHNDYLGLAAEVGLPAALILVALLVAGLVMSVGAQLTPLRAAVTAGAVNLAFANVLVTPVVIAGFWICLGCLLAHRRRHRAGVDRVARLHHRKEEVHAR